MADDGKLDSVGSSKASRISQDHELQRIGGAGFLWRISCESFLREPDSLARELRAKMAQLDVCKRCEVRRGW